MIRWLKCHFNEASTFLANIPDLSQFLTQKLLMAILIIKDYANVYHSNSINFSPQAYIAIYSSNTYAKQRKLTEILRVIDTVYELIPWGPKTP